jgi:hypothetical protein
VSDGGGKDERIMTRKEGRKDGSQGRTDIRYQGREDISRKEGQKEGRNAGTKDTKKERKGVVKGWWISIYVNI